jgi:glycosyltransferase involved in cell wall biosynthesis
LIIYPKISVLLPVYNCELYIIEAIDSILNQTFTDFELLIIDDASTDNTVSIIKSYTDSRIILTQKPINLGYTDSLNYGLKIAKGEYIARMDGDDISMPNRFEKQIAFLDKNQDVVLCGANYTIIGSDKCTQLPNKNDEIQIQFIRNNCIAHPVVMFRNSVFKENAIFYDVTKEPAEDFDLWVRLLNYGKLHNLPDTLLMYRVHQNQVSNLQSKKQQNVSIDTKFNLFKNLEIIWSKKEEKILKMYLSNNYFIDLNQLEILKNLFNTILQKNKNKSVFNQQVVTQYLKKEENRLLLRYFTRNSQYKPQVIFEYFSLKKNFNPQFSLQDQIKLILKSLFFYKTK